MAKAKKLTKAKKKPSALKKKQVLKSKKKVTKKPSVRRKAKKVLAVPKGYNSVIPYLMVNEASKIIDFYKKVFNAKEVMRIEHAGQIGHAELKIGDTRVMLADECPDSNANSPKKLGGSSVAIHLYVKDVDNVATRALSAGAKLVRPVEDRFYGDRSGTVEDPQGHIWHISSRVENVSSAKIKKRATELFGKK